MTEEKSEKLDKPEKLRKPKAPAKAADRPSAKPVDADRAGSAKPSLSEVVSWSRFVQVPLLLGLAVAMALLLAAYVVDISRAFWLLDFMDRKKTILLVLDILDMVFIANLIVMVSVNCVGVLSRSTSVPYGEEDKLADRSYKRMKTRIVSTIVIISSIHLLHEFLESASLTLTDIIGLAALHLVILATYVVMNVIYARGEVCT